MEEKNLKLQEELNKFLLYTTSNGDIKVKVLFGDETIWATQKMIAEIFGVEINTINYHLKEIFKTSELKEDSVIRKFRITASDGKSYETRFYNLDAIISVGYRVNSSKATQFRIWATEQLREFIIKGFVIDSDRLKNGSHFGQDYFEELLEKIREIRVSERRFYQKITDIYALSADYDKSAKTTREFFTTIQNKLHWAITGKTASEIIYDSADSNKPNMGLTNWKNSPDGKILKSDTLVAKNYLTKEHIKELEQIVSAYLDLAENRAKRKIVMTMDDWVTFLNKFIELNSYPNLEDSGKISKLKAELKASEEYEKFRVIQDNDYISDFDEEIKNLRL